MEEGKVGVYLQYPVRLYQDDGTDVDEARPSGEERLVLHPSDEVVQAPRHIEEYGAAG